MKKQLLKYANIEVPRYTSYPTAVQFHSAIDESQYRQWLGALSASEPVSLYVHIPFCEKMCWYCGCHTNVVNGYDRISAYVDDLLHEIELISKAGSGAIGPVTHLHFGGGSPSMLKPEDFDAIVAKLKANFSFAPNAEIAVEIDPRTVDQAKAERYAAIGVNRVSLGVQDFNEHVQLKINRIQPPEQVRQVKSWLQDAGIAAVNFDLIYGLPGQSLDDIAKSIEIALSMQPDRFAVFGYAHVPWFKKHQEMIKQEDLPDTQLRLAQADLVAELLVAAGYIRIGFDHYAKADDPLGQAMRQNRVRRNFQGYTDDNCDVLIGFGASSISALPDGYVQNDPHMGKWRQAVRAGNLPIVRGLALSDDDKFRGQAIMQILSLGFLDLAAHCQAAGRELAEFDDALAKLAPLEQDGLVKLDDNTVRVTAEGIRFSRNIAACFDVHWQRQENRHSLAV
ncbi:MAG: oxygen-independent coproporphyrinogen III oxidase [Robiginitomaculum sp.]|nr:MAG: oxygen-independent coproporphyrinogen III oxidase [Robiginitomaculum sp.]